MTAKKVVCLGVAFLVLTGCLWLYTHHVITTEKGTVVLQKRFLTFHNSFVDVREWSSERFDRNSEIKNVLIANGYRDLLIDRRMNEIKVALRGVWDGCLQIVSECTL